MCHICELVSLGCGASGVSVHADCFGAAPAKRRATPTNLEAAHGAAASAMPRGVGTKGRKTLIKGGVVLSMDPRVGNFAVGDVLVDGSKIAEVAASIHAPDAAVVAGIERDLFRA